MTFRRTNLVPVILLLLVALAALAACSPAATPAPPTAAPTSPPPPTAAPTNTLAPTAVPPTAAPTSPAATATSTVGPSPTPPAPKAITLQIVQNDTLGKFIVDGEGRTLYMYTRDTRDTSNCYNNCAVSWPILVPLGKPTLKEGLTADLIGTTQRKDGATQLTYNSWPLYYYFKDAKAGDTTGQAVGKVWWVLSAEGNPIRPAGLQVSKNDKLGQILVDDLGHTVYAYSKDSKNTTVCYDKCEQSWPPVISLGKPTLGEGVNASLVGSVTRKDGTTQITYNGLPLYYYSKDLAVGDTTGQGVGSVWYVLAPDGSVMK